MRLSHTALAAATLAAFAMSSGATMAQTAPKSAAPASQPATARQIDPLLAKVNGAEIHLSDLNALAQTLPEEARQMPPDQLLPQLLDQAIDGKAISFLAKKQKLDQDPQVARAMAGAADRMLQSALVSKEVGPTLTEEAIKARYDKQIAGKPGELEVHARHILVKTEAEAVALIAQIKGGADFAELAKKNSTDPAAASGGDLGFFKEGDMLPEFSAVAFALKPGEVADKPVQTRYGWHVVKVEERRQAPAPAYEQVHDELRSAMIQEGITKVVQTARADVKVERFNQDGSPMKATDTATPPAKK